MASKRAKTRKVVGFEERIAGAHRTDTVKATIVGGTDRQASNVMQGVDEMETAFAQAGGIEPPYNMGVLVSLFEMSNSLRQNVDAYATNIDGFGHTFKPVIDLDASDADQRIAHAIYMERLRGGMDAAPGQQTQPLIPTPEEVAARKEQMVQEMRLEKARLEHFFEFASEEMSFIALRRALRQDNEQLGNAYVEVLRNGAGEIVEFVYVPGFTVRLLPLDATLTEYQTPRKVTDIDYEPVTRKKAFRRFVQVLEHRIVFFKEFGDPRPMSRRTGAYTDQFVEGDGPATELLHFKIRSTRSSYGIPRWIGNLLSVFGSRQAEEVNHAYFENKSVPPLAVLVSGGRLTEQSVKKLESFVETEIKGKKNFHKILVLEAVSAAVDDFDNQGHMKVDIKPLTDAMHKDALFSQYDERNIDKVGMAFRLPRLLRGDIRDFNRASAEAALEFAEQQVFGPERQEFDWTINRRIFPLLNVRYWRFESNSPTTKDPSMLAEIIVKLVVANVLTPEEARDLAQGVFNIELPNIDLPWTKQPVALTLAGMQGAADVDGPFTGEEAGPGQQHGGYDQTGEASADAAAVQASEKDDATTGDLAQGGGLNRGGGPGRRLRRMPAPAFAKQAEQLIALRNILLNMEAKQAQKDFAAAKAEGDGALQ